MSGALSRSAGAYIDRSTDPLAAVLAMCEEGRTALVRAATVTEARDVLAAISTLEHAVKVRDMNQQAVVAASTLRIRAERRVGELLIAADVGPGRPKRIVDGDDNLPSRRLPDVVTRDESSKFQRLAAAPAQKFERAVEKVAQNAVEKRVQVTREAVMREIDPAAERSPSDGWKDGDRFKGACDRIADLAEAAADAIRWSHFPGTENADLVTTATLLSMRTAREAIDRVERELVRRRKSK